MSNSNICFHGEIRKILIDLRLTCSYVGSVQMAKWLVRLTSDHKVRVQILEEAEFNSLLYCASLHNAFHYHPSIIPI